VPCRSGRNGRFPAEHLSPESPQPVVEADECFLMA
jgi:hypothetical protein